MLTHLKLHNFQNHRKLEIPLSKITTIIGESDTGKSAVIRALQWLCLNSLQGDSFITHGKKKCYVLLSLSDYGDIVRRRGSGINGYILNDDEQRNAIGRDVPADIATILNIGEINIAAQHDPPFWFTLTASQLTKELNAIADIAWLDRVMQASNSNLRKAQTELDVTANRIASLENSLKESEYVETMDNELQSLENQDEKVQLLKSQCEQLTDIIDRLESCHNDIRIFQKIVNHFNRHIVPAYDQCMELKNNTDRIEQLIVSYPQITEKTIADLQTLQENHQQIDTIKNQFHKITQIVESYPQITEETITDLQTLQENHQLLTSTQDQFNRLTDLLSCPSELPVSEIKQLQSQYQQLTDSQDQYSKLTALLVNVPDSIPTSEEIMQLSEQMTNIQIKQKEYSRLDEIIDQLVTMTDEYRKTQSQYQQLEQELHKQLEGVCPICGNSI